MDSASSTFKRIKKKNKERERKKAQKKKKGASFGGGEGYFSLPHGPSFFCSLPFIAISRSLLSFRSLTVLLFFFGFAERTSTEVNLRCTHIYALFFIRFNFVLLFPHIPLAGSPFSFDSFGLL